jgi:hypothetical protein
MSQRQIAQLLGVCEPRVSRLLDAAQLKLWTAIRRGIGRSALSTIEHGQIVDALSELVAERRRAAPRASCLCLGGAPAPGGERLRLVIEQ